MIDLIRREPAVVTALVVAVLGVLVAFGVPVSDGQRDAIVALVNAALVVAGGLFVRSRVTPVK